MSEAQEGEARPRAEEDVIATGRIVAVGVTALVVFLLASLASTWVMAKRREALLPEGPPPIPAEVGKPRIGMLEQQTFEDMRRAQDLRDEQLRWLESYGWVDRRAGTVHVPIEQAMKRVAEGQRP